MSIHLIAERYEVEQETEDRFVCKAIVKDRKAYGKKRTLLSIKPEHVNNPNIVSWFNSQSEMFSNISSDHVVNFIDSYAAGEIMQSPSVVVEEPGKTLKDLMTDGPILPLAAQNIVIKILMGVNELHESGYLHLDLSPANIGVNLNATEVKLLTLGNCVRMNSDFMPLTPNTKYMAAECYSQSLNLDRSTDIYSIGILFYELLVGKGAFNSQFASIFNVSSVEEQATNWTNWHVGDRALTPLDEVAIGVDPDLAELVSKMTSKDAEQRYTNASTVINELNQIVGIGSAVGLTGSFNGNRSDKKGSKPWLMIAGVALSAVLSIGLIGAKILLPIQSTTPAVDVAAIDLLTQQTELQRSVIHTFGWLEAEELAVANNQYQLVHTAFDSKDYAAMHEHLKQSNALYRSFIDANVGTALNDLGSAVDTLVEKAVYLGVDDLTSTESLSLEFTELSELEAIHSAYSVAITNLEHEIKHNSRTRSLGSSQAQIEEALKQCQQFSSQCDLAWYQSELERQESFTPYELDKREVTVKQFREYVETHNIVTLAEKLNGSGRVINATTDFAIQREPGLNWSNTYESDSDNLPVVHVTYEEAAAYCRSVQKRLPTESEWELVAGGTERKLYPWGQRWEEGEVYWSNGAGTSQELGAVSLPPNSEGVYALASGVSEWTSSTLKNNQYAYIKGVSQFDYNQANYRTAQRRLEPLAYTGEDVGFRCARDKEVWETDAAVRVSAE